MEGDEEPWSPEDDQAEKDYMKIAKQFMKEQLENLREMKEAQAKSRSVRTPQAPPGMSAFLTLGGPSTPTITFRRIENGFIMTYNEVKEVKEAALGMSQALPLPAGAPPGLAQALSAMPHVHRVEIFVRDAAEALSHLQAAMTSLEKLSKLPGGGFFA